ncbi:uncharacterized protein BT62DRAFT_1003568 [Guyanagaster necrorhizus]|uniref:Uncharacterized protein n=1 Tax=Guyanagaster necrorhizus TaxID=856835 RepID=A0A9P7VZW7_9AGAR|nr:uncharacterized protein BT62DRAFT_1003568 [Guyanagaster necrorhizus MCA 3950]KAG7448841.1 hypothetical protein BT62DRAFT_1003568 [Guyanagaster necrorhizus MCA 3950]
MHTDCNTLSSFEIKLTCINPLQINTPSTGMKARVSPFFRTVLIAYMPTAKKKLGIAFAIVAEGLEGVIRRHPAFLGFSDTSPKILPFYMRFDPAHNVLDPTRRRQSSSNEEESTSSDFSVYHSFNSSIPPVFTHFSRSRDGVWLRRIARRKCWISLWFLSGFFVRGISPTRGVQSLRVFTMVMSERNHQWFLCELHVFILSDTRVGVFNKTHSLSTTESTPIARLTSSGLVRNSTRRRSNLRLTLITVDYHPRTLTLNVVRSRSVGYIPSKCYVHRSESVVKIVWGKIWTDVSDFVCGRLDE